MKPKITPVNSEIELRDDDVIISKTDLKGRITYANRTFMRIAHYSERELLNVQHNIIRHPDMPRGAFKLLWDTLQKGDEFFAYVKNLAGDGRYYWVFANVTPDRDANGRVVGYYSVRRKPRKEAIKVMEGLYRDMLAVEARAGSAAACEASIKHVVSLLNEQKSDYPRFILSL